jgi:hypothetical protein
MKIWKQLSLFMMMSLAACGSGNSIGGLDAEEIFNVPLTQSAEVPAPKATSASGTATLVLFSDRVEFEIIGASITGVTMAHIHNGAPGVAGPIVVTLYNQPASPSGTINGVLVSGTLNSGNLPTGVTVESLKALLLSGNAYVNVHTSTNPSGEIRGQVK